MNFGPINKKMPSIIHGGDYNPEQWIDYEGVWDEDFRLMELAHCNVMSIGIFSWSMLEVEEGIFDFSWMDEIMDRLAKAGKYAVLATPSGARPAWLSQKYPEVLRVNEDRTKKLHGGRHNHCYTSPVYREKTRIINEKLASKYKNHPALLLWHVSNEYSGECHCDMCQEAFREWLKDKYKDDIDMLNHAWWTTFWSHRYTDWSQIESPSSLGEDSVHGLVLDWKRFVTHQTKDFMLNEMEPLRRITPNARITTNFMRNYMELNFWEIAKQLDIVSWDSYPYWHKNKDEIEEAVQIAFMHDIMRCLKGGRPFMLMESTPSVTNWQETSKLKRPGMHMLASMQAIAHGSDTVQYFQWRKSRGSFEKLHGAVIDHCGHENTRVFKDVAQLGEALEKLDEIVGTSVQPETAIIYDWENFWAIEEAKGINNSAKKYYETTICHYKPFWEAGIPVDVIDMEQPIDKYKVVVAPMLYMIKPGVEERIDSFVKAGGTFVATYVSGIANGNDLCFLGGFPGPLRKILGVWVEETDGLYPEDRNHVEVSLNGMGNKAYEAKEICDLIHTETVEVIGHYKEDFYAGYPALTVNNYGKGRAYYIAFRNNGDFEKDFYNYLIMQENLKPVIEADIPKGISVQTRYDHKSKFVFIMNFTTEEKEINLDKIKYTDVLSGENISDSISISGYGVRVLRVK